MRGLGFLMLSAALVFCAVVSGADDDADRDNPPIPPAEIRRVNINVFPNQVIIVRGKMVAFEELREHLKDLVPDARKAAVDVLVIPHSRKEMSLVSKIIVIAKELGYTKVSFLSPPKHKPKLTEITVLLSKTGDVFVNDVLIGEKELKGQLEKLVDEDRREKVRITIRASRLVKIKKVTEVTELCRELGFKDIVFAPIAE